MATRQYIGARYVPKFYQNSVDGSTQWESNVVYEPLIWVTLQNGHMYISKKQVPATVGSPAENIDYWLDIGSYNGQIENLQGQIDDMKDGTVSGSLQAQINAIATDLTAAKTEIDTKQTKVYHKAIIVGDSWAVGYYNGQGHAGEGWGDYACRLLGISTSNILTIASGGSGFCNSTGENFKNQIARAYNDFPAFRDADLILCVGGFNDAQDNQTYDAVKVAAGEFFGRCKYYFPNAETHMFPLQLPYMSPMTAVRHQVLSGILNGYWNQTGGNLFMHLGVHLWANEWGVGASAGDGSHLNQYGYNYMGQKIAELVRQGGDYYPVLFGTINLTNWASYIDDTQNNYVYQYGDNITVKLAVHVQSLPATAKAVMPWFATTSANHFLPIDSTYFLTLDTNGLGVNGTYTGWVFLEKTFTAGML